MSKITKKIIFAIFSVLLFMSLSDNNSIIEDLTDDSINEIPLELSEENIEEKGVLCKKPNKPRLLHAGLHHAIVRDYLTRVSFVG